VQQWIKEVARGKRGSKDLSYEETREVASLIVKGKATDAQLAAYFIAQRLKTESAEELLAFVHAFQEHSERLTLDVRMASKMIDFAGPYNGRHYFAATIPCSILLAERGIPVFLHSSDSLPPKYGTSIKEILDRLGVDVSLKADALADTIERTKLGFAWTDQFCPILKKIRPIREQIGVRTLLNTVEKLLNLSNASSVMMGAYHRTAINKITPMISKLGYKNVYIVQGMEGSEDLPVHRNSFIFKLTKESVDSFVVKPEDYGLSEEEDEPEKLTAEEQSEIIMALLQGRSEKKLAYYYKQVLFNTGVRYYLFGVTSSIEEGIAIAEEQLKNQRGMQQLKKWRGERVRS
jgi:anthranilate phosphoribosyltransferase